MLLTHGIELPLRLLLWLLLLGLPWHVQALGREQGTVASSVVQWLQDRRAEAPFSLAPGIAVAIVSEHGAHVELLMGDGVQSLRVVRKPVTEHTLFEIGSVSKTLIALALATLVDKRVLTWDVRVADVLGSSFGFGPDNYVRDYLTLRDLLSHRSGLAEGQGDFLGGLRPSAAAPQLLRRTRLGHGFREVFDYSNTGWTLAGEVLRVAANTSSWCAALKMHLLGPLAMHETFCDRNAVSESQDDMVADVHKSSHCDGTEEPTRAFRHADVRNPRLQTFRMTRTGRTGTFAWGAADAAGSVLSSASDMSRMMSLLLGAGTSGEQAPLGVPQVVRKGTLKEMMSAQMLVPPSWAAGLGMPGWTRDPRPGVAFAAGLGFDLVGQFPSTSSATALRGLSYAEKNGDTAMHKARIGLLLDAGIGVMLMSNLGGEVGGQLTALKFGALALAAGATDQEASDVLEQTMQTTSFWSQHFAPAATCTPCKSVLGDSAICAPGNLSRPPVELDVLAGMFGDDFYGPAVLGLSVQAGSLAAHLGPVHAVLDFGAHHTVIRESCTALAKRLPPAVGADISRSTGLCVMVEFRIPSEIPAAGISMLNHTIAFPWGCGTVPLPTAMPIYVIVSKSQQEAWAWLPTADVIFPRQSQAVDLSTPGSVDTSVFV
mmetsp:Transcript_44513/g.141754  ORF Transcript_44513/g.141754 Transcript_44513/m.141754 type:complete len:657 (-) Transcript_44513:76-2046(-)